MATLNSTEYAEAYVDQPAVLQDNNQHGGTLRRIKADLVLKAEVAIGDVLRMFKLPQGAIINTIRCQMPDDVTSGIYDVGWDAGEGSLETADPNGLMTALDSGAGAVDSTTLATAGLNKQFDDTVTISLTCTEATNASDGDTIQLEIVYSYDA